MITRFVELVCGHDSSRPKRRWGRRLHVEVLESREMLSLDNNLRIVDLSDLNDDLPLNVDSTTQILEMTETWENNNTFGFTTVVKND